MSKKIVGILKPFDLNHSFYVYDGEKIDYINPDINEMPSQLFALAEKYGITQVDLTGPKQYLVGIKQYLLKEEKIKYNKNKLNINLI